MSLQWRYHNIGKPRWNDTVRSSTIRSRLYFQGGKEMYISTPTFHQLRLCRRTYIEVLQKGQVRSTHNRRVLSDVFMNVAEARGVCKDRSRWRSVVSTYPHGEKAWVYVCMYLIGGKAIVIKWTMNAVEPSRFYEISYKSIKTI